MSSSSSDDAKGDKALSSEAESPANGDSSRKKQREKQKVTPTLSAYFGPTPVSVSAFLHAVKAEKTLRFTDSDYSDAAQLMNENDANGVRLLGLVSQTSLPEAVDRSVWQLVQLKLKAEIPAAFETAETDPASTFRTLHEEISASLSSPDKEQRIVGATLLRLSMAWLISKRSLDPWTALEQLKTSFYKDPSAGSRSARHILARGKVPEIRNAAAIAFLAQDKVRAANARRDIELERAIRLQSQLNAAQIEIQALVSTLKGEETQRIRIGDELADARKDLEVLRQHAGHDMDAITSAHQLKLGKLRPLLSDAVDALEIIPAAPSIALSRIKAAINTVEEAN